MLWRKNYLSNFFFSILSEVQPLGFGYLKAGLLARKQYSSGRPTDRPCRPRFSVVFVGPRARTDMLRKFNVALHAYHSLKNFPLSAACLMFSKFRQGSPPPQRKSNPTAQFVPLLHSPTPLFP